MYSDKVRREVLALYRDGKNLVEISRVTPVSVSTARIWVKAAGIPVRKGGQKPMSNEVKDNAIEKFIGGMPVSQISQETGVSIVSIGRWIKEAGYSLRACNRSKQGPISQDIKEKAIRQYIDGVPVVEIASQAGVDRKTINDWVRAAGIPARKTKPEPISQDMKNKVFEQYIEGMFVSRIALEAGVSATSVDKWVKKAGIFVGKRRNDTVSQHVKDKAVEMFCLGQSAHQIARQLGVSIRAVRSWVKAAGIPL